MGHTEKFNFPEVAMDIIFNYSEIVKNGNKKWCIDSGLLPCSEDCDNCEQNFNSCKKQGVKNSNSFKQTTLEVLAFYYNLFGNELLETLYLHIENMPSSCKIPCLSNGAVVLFKNSTGHAPILTPMMNGNTFILKLGISNGKNVDQTIFQIAHELMHFFFFVYCKNTKEKQEKCKEVKIENYKMAPGNVPEIEETLCTAMSLCVMNKKLSGSVVDKEKRERILWNYYSEDSMEYYKEGHKRAKEIDYDWKQLEDLINEVIDYYNKVLA